MIYHVRGGNFCSLGTWGGYQPGGYINGENVIVKLSEDGYPPTENTKLSYKFNSCFADVIEPNDDGTDTYTVKVANAGGGRETARACRPSRGGASGCRKGTLQPRRRHATTAAGQPSRQPCSNLLFSLSQNLYQTNLSGGPFLRD